MRRRAALALAALAWLVAIPVQAATGGDVVLDPGAQRQLITDWGYDIKQGGKAAGVTPGYARTLFVTDKMTCLRLPIWGTASDPAHPASGVVVESYYADTLYAMTNSRAARSNIVFFASKKLDGTNSFPAWVKDANGIIPSKYAELLADFLQFMQSKDFVVDVLGIDNETEYNEGDITPSRHKQTIDALRSLSAARGFTMPARLIGPDTYSPKPDWVDGLVTNGWGDRLDMVGTHYYPQWRSVSKLRDLVAAAGVRPAWHTEVHWNSDANLDDIDEAELALATIFDSTDSGLSGFAWWSYTRSGVKGGIEQAITASTAGTRPIDIDDSDGTGTGTYGQLITRAFASETNVVVWAINNTNQGYPACLFNLARGVVTGSVAFTQWTTKGATTGTAARIGDTAFTLTLSSNSVTMLNFAFTPLVPVGVWHLDETAGNNAADATGHGYTGALNNGPVWSNSLGRATLAFNGTNQYVSVAGLPDLTNALTVTLWARSATTEWNTYGMLASRRSQFVLHPWSGANKQISFIVFDTGNVQRRADFNLVSLPGFDLTQWHHYAGTYAAGSGLVVLYVDGQPRATTNLGPGTLLQSDSGPMTLGRDDGMNRYFKGALDEVQLYDRALSQAEIAVLATAVPPAIRGVRVVSTNLVFEGNGGVPGAPYTVLAATNIALPLANWLPVTSNVFGLDGGFTNTLPISLSLPRRFHRLRVP